MRPQRSAVAPQDRADPPRPALKSAASPPRNVFVDKNGWYVSKASVVAGDNEAPETVRHRALLQARRAAIEHRGMIVEGAYFHVEQMKGAKNVELFSDTTRVLSRALIVAEEVTHDSKLVATTEGAYRYTIRIRVKIADRGAADPDYTVKAEMSRRVMQEGEKIELKITPSRSSFLYVISVSEDQSGTVLMPSPLFTTNYTEGQKTVVVPPPSADLVASLPKGRSHAFERLKIFASKQRLPLEPKDAKDGLSTFEAGGSSLVEPLFRALANVPASDWCETEVTYEVRKK